MIWSNVNVSWNKVYLFWLRSYESRRMQLVDSRNGYIYAVPNTLYLVSIKQWTFLTRTCLHWYFLTTIERPTWLLPKSEAFNAYPNWQTELCCVLSDIKEGCIIFKDGTFKIFIATLMWKLVFSRKKTAIEEVLKAFTFLCTIRMYYVW